MVNMRLLFIFAILAVTIITNATSDADNSDALTPTPVPATTDSGDYVDKLCFYINSITLKNMQWDSDILSAWAHPKGIVYAYDPEQSLKSFRSFDFAITKDMLASTVSRRLQESSTSAPETTSASPPSLPTEFSFGSGETSDNLVGCWTQPSFHEFNLRFKVYEYFFTSLKAITVIPIPAISTGEQTASITLQTLQYRYSTASVQIQYTLQWSQTLYTTYMPTYDGEPHHNPVVRPWILPGQAPPPVDAAAAVAVLFDSDERSDSIINAEKADGDEENVQVPQMAEEDVVGAAGSQRDVDDSDESSSSSWMLFAALCSSALGLFVLVYICIWAYKTYGRNEYESIPTVMNAPSAPKSVLGKVRKISLRNIESHDEERRNIMHPSASYTFED